MTKYVALLRGINVGGKARVEMPRLKNVFEKNGMTDVLTYINSGNIIFSDKRSHIELKPIIEAAIADEFGFDVYVVLRERANIALLDSKIPSSWTNDTKLKTDVMFLWDEIDDKSILKKIVINPKIENVLYLPGALIWNIGRENVTRGGGVKLIKTDLYKQMTVRNINTVRKLNELMKT
jgi:uncharacterized protein (DUF1697 family)